MSVVQRSSVVAWLSASGLALAISCIGGCGEKSRYVSVTGKVSYRGEPFPRGSVTFFPASGRPINAPIIDGEYQAQLQPEEYVVILGVSTPLPPGYKEGDRLPPPKFVLPPQYTTRAKSTLRASVAPDQSEPIDFALE